MPFAFNAVELYVVTINEKPWINAREVCKAWKYEKAVRRVVRHHFASENIQHKHQLVVVQAMDTTVNWPRDSQKLDLYINEERKYKRLFSSQQPKAKDFRRHCCNVLFPHIRQQLTKKNERRPSTSHQRSTKSLIWKRGIAQLQTCQDQIRDLIINSLYSSYKWSRQRQHCYNYWERHRPRRGYVLWVSLLYCKNTTTVYYHKKAMV